MLQALVLVTVYPKDVYCGSHPHQDKKNDLFMSNFMVALKPVILFSLSNKVSPNWRRNAFFKIKNM